MLNGSSAKVKKSDVEKKTDRYIVMTMLMQVLVCVIAGIIFTLKTKNKAQFYGYLNAVGYPVDPEERGDEVVTDFSVMKTFGVSFGTWFLAMMNFVPISLLVTLEMCKYIQGVFIGWDKLMIDEEKKMFAKA
jgi:phospholipid-transporting ATPase